MLQPFRISRAEVAARFQAWTNGEWVPVWPDDPRLPTLATSVKGLITLEHLVDAELLAKWAGLEVLSLGFTGCDRVDFEYCRSRGLTLYNVPDYSSDSVAELAVGVTLTLLRRLTGLANALRAGDWPVVVEPGIELRGKRVGVLGLGAIGRRVAALFATFGCEVQYWGRHARPDAGVRFEADLDRLLAHSNIVTLHLPVTDETRGLLGATRLARMPAGAVLINVSRSALVDMAALTASLEGGRLAGVGLDLTEPDDLQLTAKLRTLPNVILTPHVGFRTVEALHRLELETIENFRRFMDRNPEHRVLEPHRA
jgi:D-3-phosphoglycerate dehydrogenase